MKEILNLMPALFVAIAMNISAGLYYNIGTKKLSFDWQILLSGVIKASIIVGIFLGTTYCFQATDLSSIGITPNFIITSAICLYVTKALISLSKILGVPVNISTNQDVTTYNPKEINK